MDISISPHLVPPIDSILDKSQFDETISCIALKCERNKTHFLSSHFQPRLINTERFQKLSWLVKLGPTESDPLAKSILIFNDGISRNHLSQNDLTVISQAGAEIIDYSLQIGFDNRPTEWILNKLLPNIPNVTSHFEIVGHIAHLNLRGDDVLANKFLIGAVILEKNKSSGIRTVVNKIGFVDNEFRVLPMELIAGEPDTFAEVLECGCIFKFDFSEVFWNSRLQGEHQRIVQLCKPSDIVCDMFAGVGPFAIPLARNGVRVYANDLNPKSYEWMVANAQSNIPKRKMKNISCYCLDGREFVRKVLREEKIGATQVIMNLPKLSPEFCDVFVGLFHPGSALPRVHVYCFGTGDTPEIMASRALDRIQTALGGADLKGHRLDVLKVRQTSTNTLEFCISFDIPPEIGYSA